MAHLRALLGEGAAEQQKQEHQDLLDEVITARKELVERVKYLEVAFDYDFDAAKVFQEMKDANPSSIVLKAVTESRKRKAATKTKDTEERRKKKPETNTSANSTYSWRSANYQPPPAQHYWPQAPAPQTAHHYGAYSQPFPPSAPYGRQAGTAFRPPSPPGCFNCGDSSHGYRRCPNVSSSAPPPPPKAAPPT